MVLGTATMVAEAVLVREGMSAFAGSELAWALVLSAWLAGVGAGAWLAAGRRGTGWDRWLALVVVFLAAAGVLLLRAIPALAGITAGETAPGWHAFWVWPVAVLPAALAGGVAFSLLAGRLRGRVPARAYAAEAAGALLGGLVFTFLLAGAGTAVALVSTAGLLGAFRLRHRPAAAVAVIVLAAGACLPARTGLERLSWRWSGHPGQLASWAETRRQRLEMTAGEPHALYADGRLVASWPDPWGTGVRAHLMMLFHPHPARILAVGAVFGGAVPLLLDHRVDRLDLVEEDPAVFRLIPQWYGPSLERSLADPRVNRLARDPLTAARDGGPWDLVLLLDPDPVSLRRNRTRTVEFFRVLAGRLAPGGRVVVATSVPDTYLGGAGGRLLAILSATLRRAFPEVTGIPGEQVLLVAGASLDDLASPRALVERWNATGLRDPVFGPDLIPVLLDPGRAGPLNRFLAGEEAPADRTVRPVAVLPAMALAEGRGAPRLASWLERLQQMGPRFAGGLAILVGVLIAGTGLRSRRAAGEAAAFALGLASMGVFVLLLGAWQSTRGSVFAEIGALTAAFMAGIGSGGLVAARGGRRRERGLSFMGLAVLLLVAGLPLPFAVPLVIPFLLPVAGLLTGLAFSAAAGLAGEGSEGAGRGFAADEIGAALGALVCGLLLPVVGSIPLALSLAVLVALAAPAVFRHARSR